MTRYISIPLQTLAWDVVRKLRLFTYYMINYGVFCASNILRGSQMSATDLLDPTSFYHLQDGLSKVTFLELETGGKISAHRQQSKMCDFGMRPSLVCNQTENHSSSQKTSISCTPLSSSSQLPWIRPAGWTSNNVSCDNMWHLRKPLFFEYLQWNYKNI